MTSPSKPGKFALLALGSNLGDREATLRAAVEDLRATPGVTIINVSRFIETDPVDMVDQPRFLNGSVLISTTLSPRELLKRCLRIETAHGRQREATVDTKHVSRTLDLDLLLYGEHIIDQPGLRIPHPRMHERLFVLTPAEEIAGEMRHPALDATIAELLARLAG